MTGIMSDEMTGGAGMTRRALIAMSGGVDSSVAAYLMKEHGYDCIGATMKLFDQSMLEGRQDHGRPSDDLKLTEESKCAPAREKRLEKSEAKAHEQQEISDLTLPGRSRTCCSLDDVEDARSVAFKLGIPYYVFNFSDDFEQMVMRPFVESYERGDTPNPCIDCNRCLKFRHLLRRAMELKCDVIVTGHYARIEERDGRYLLRKGADEKKDQSYVLYNLTQEELAHTVFPLGGMSKEQIRQIAQEQGFINAAKPDSQDICFVPDGDYVRFMERYTGHSYPEGDFIDREGHVLGKHNGAVRYTIGQRKGLGIAFGEPMYVISKDMQANTVTLAGNDELFSRELVAGDLNWIAIDRLDAPMEVAAKIRYKHKEQPAVLYPETDGTVRAVFHEPQRAITPGQAVVFYNGDIVIGGGRIR